MKQKDIDKLNTPMIRQYLRIRGKLDKDVLLFFRLGDFFELFFEDAKKVSSVLDLTLTNRNGVPMAGFPHYSLQIYLDRLLKV